MTDPNGAGAARNIWCAMDPIKKKTQIMLVYIPAPAGSVMGMGI